MTRLFSFLVLASAAVVLASGSSPVHAAQLELQDLAGPQDAVFVKVGDRVDRPALPPGAKPTPAPTLAQTSNAITAHVTAHFIKAAGAPDKRLTKQEAQASGWGWAADHFDDIDGQKKGSVSLDDVLGYISRTSHMALPRTSGT
ncbi:hypothetical protein ACVBGC_32100 [Burkholderia stagnalis]